MSFEKHKTDPALGLVVHAHLTKLGIETPMIASRINVDAKTKIEQLIELERQKMEILGLDLSDDSLYETPKRVAKMTVLENYWGLIPTNFPKITTIENKFKSKNGYGSKVTVGPIELVSKCEHHQLEILGEAYVSYIPKDRVMGLSKFSRVVEYFAKRPQVQERLTEQICETLQLILDTDDVAVSIYAEHLCMTTRGVEDPCAATATCSLSGSYLTNDGLKTEYLHDVDQLSSRRR